MRHLDIFQLCLNSNTGHLVPLEDVEGAAQEIIAQGEIIPADKVKPGVLPSSMHASKPANRLVASTTAVHFPPHGNRVLKHPR